MQAGRTDGKTHAETGPKTVVPLKISGDQNLFEVLLSFQKKIHWHRTSFCLLDCQGWHNLKNGIIAKSFFAINFKNQRFFLPLFTNFPNHVETRLFILNSRFYQKNTWELDYFLP